MGHGSGHGFGTHSLLCVWNRVVHGGNCQNQGCGWSVDGAHIVCDTIHHPGSMQNRCGYRDKQESRKIFEYRGGRLGGHFFYKSVEKCFEY